MKLHNFIFALSIFILLSSLLAAQQTGGGPGSGGGRPSGGAPQSGTGGDSGMISETEISLRSNSISVAGRLQPRSRIIHKASVSGYVGAVSVDKGDYVQAGDHLFRIDRNDIGQSFKPVYVDARISGVVSEIDIQIYSDINEGSPGVTIVETDSYTVEAAISDKDAFKITVGQAVTGINPEGLSINGTLTGRSQEPDYNTGLFSLSFQFPEEEGFYIGSFILIQLPTDQIKGVFISRNLLVRRYGSYFLWVITDENRLIARKIKAGVVFGEDIHIVSGLNPGERYLSRLTGKETEGMEVKRVSN